jgi:hypothetical protein
MTQKPEIPDEATRKQEVEKLRNSSRQLEGFTLALDEVIALVEEDLRKQRRIRFEAKNRFVDQEIS